MPGPWAECRLSTLELDFGTVLAGETAFQTLKVYNDGDDFLTTSLTAASISELGLTPPGPSGCILADPQLIPIGVEPGDSCLFLDGTYEAPFCSAKNSDGSTCTQAHGWWLDTGREQQDEYFCTGNKQVHCGEPGRPITIRSVNGADHVIFTQEEPAGTCNDHMRVELNCSYLRFQGLTFRSGRNYFAPGSSHIELTENVFKCSGTASGSTMVSSIKRAMAPPWRAST